MFNHSTVHCSNNSSYFIQVVLTIIYFTEYDHELAMYIIIVRRLSCKQHSVIYDDDILMHFGGLEQNSLIRVLNTINDDQDTIDDAPVLIWHSPYYDDAKLLEELKNDRYKFNILSLNCESINAKIDQIRLKLAQYKDGGCNFNAICLQETWLSEDSDKSLLRLDGYTLISLGKTCSARGGLIIHLKDNLKYKLLNMSLKSNI